MSAIRIDWSDETHSCIHAIYGHGWDWPEFFATDETAKAMLDTLDHKADFILELEDVVLPKNVVGQFPQFVRGAASLTHPNSRRVVIVGSGSHVQILLSIFQKVYPAAAKKVFLAASADEAHRILDSMLAGENG
jgi:hypothetical protein